MATLTGNELTITRVFDAPRETVWKAFTEPTLVAKWWGPKGFRNTIHEMNVRPGGTWRFIMHGPDGTDYPNEIVYDEIKPPERIVFRHLSGPRFTATVTFGEENNRTKLVYRMVFRSPADLKAAVETFHAVDGLNQTMERLGTQLDGMQAANSTKTTFTVNRTKREIAITRTFNAPRELVWKTWTNPKLIPKWWGPRRLTTVVDRMESRTGGTWRFVQRDSSGREYAFRGVYREIVPSERLVDTFEFEGTPGHILTETVTFEAVDGKTKVTTKALFDTIEDLEGMVKAGMEEGVTDSTDRFAELLESIAKGRQQS